MDKDRAVLHFSVQSCAVKFKREEHAEVPEQFMRWVWAGVRKLKGLVWQRCTESELSQL